MHWHAHSCHGGGSRLWILRREEGRSPRIRARPLSRPLPPFRASSLGNSEHCSRRSMRKFSQNLEMTSGGAQLSGGSQISVRHRFRVLHQLASCVAGPGLPQGPMRERIRGAEASSAPYWRGVLGACVGLSRAAVARTPESSEPTEPPYRGLFPSPPLFDRMPTYRTQGKRSLNFLSARGFLRPSTVSVRPSCWR